MTREQAEQKAAELRAAGKDVGVRRRGSGYCLYDRAANRRRYWRNPEAAREARRRRYQQNPEAAREANRRRYWRNPEAAREANRRRYWRNPEAAREAQRRKYERDSARLEVILRRRTYSAQRRLTGKVVEDPVRKRERDRRSYWNKKAYLEEVYS